jgi:TPR repeat protein
MYLVVSGDYKKAFYWTNKSAIQGNSDAQNNLGLLYCYGQGVDKNIKKAGYWWGRQQMQGMHLLRMTWQCFIKMDY